MKKYIKYFGLYLLIVGILSCESKLDLDPSSSITDSSFWRTSDDAEAALWGMYGQFRGTFDIKLIVWGELRSDFWNPAVSGGDWPTELFTNDLAPTSSRTTWIRLYTLINDANLILENVPDIDFAVEEEKAAILGEAYFMRAYTYFQLAKIWGDAPILTSAFSPDGDNIFPSRNNVTEVLAQAKSDVDESISRIPTGTPGSAPWRLGKAAAQMLKADLYLWTAKLEGGGSADLNTAMAAVDQVLSSGYTLSNEYEDVFRNEANEEIIFSVNYSTSPTEDSDRRPFSSDESSRGSRGTNVGFVTILGQTEVPESLQQSIPFQVERKWLEFSEDFVSNQLNDATIDTRTNVLWQSIEDPDNPGTFVNYINKFNGEELAGVQAPVDNMIIYRYSEALFFKAEIENALGNTSNAVIYLNQAVERAYGDPDFYDASLSATDLDDAILDERIIEFALEGKSYHDIRRFGQAFTRIASLVGQESAKAGNVLLFPVAQSVINSNPRIDQTPGY